MTRKWLVTTAVALAALCAAGWWAAGRLLAAPGPDIRTAPAVRRDYEKLVRCEGQLQPLQKRSIYPKVRGRILELVEDGARVEQGALLFSLDPKPHRDDLDKQDAYLRKLKADREKERQSSIKEYRRAAAEAERRKLRADLEAVRLKEMKLGPTANDELNAQTNLANAKELLKARQEELAVLADLAKDGFISQADVRAKALEGADQQQKVNAADLAYRRLHTPDPVALAEQEFKVHDEEKNRSASQARADRVERDRERAEANFQAILKREERRRAELADNLANKLRHTAEVPGVALINRMMRRWGGVAPGRSVEEGWEVISLSDTRRMKAIVTVDEAQAALVRKGQPARVYTAGRPQGSGGLAAEVLTVAEQGRDEFDDFQRETKDLTGRANRQVFEVEVALAGEHETLRPGARVEVEIVAERLPGALVVPRAAVFREGRQPYVWMTEGTTARRQDVQVLAEDELHSALTGLEEGRRVWLVAP